MLEDCSDLEACEIRLSGAMRDVTLLGELPLSDADIDHLASLIRRTIAPDVSQGTRYLERRAPTSLAVFLVWKGIVGYREGDYWSAVETASGLGDVNWRGRWGQIFNGYLEAAGMPRFDIEGAHVYVTPILTHGGIPNSCLEEFFEAALRPLVQGALMDPSDPEEVIHELIARREDYEARAELEQRQRKLLEQRKELERKSKTARAAAEAYDDILQLWQVEASSTVVDVLANLPEDYEAFREQKHRNLEELQAAIRDHELRRAGYEHTLIDFSDRDERVLDQADLIEQLASENPASIEKRQQLTTLKAAEGKLFQQLQDAWASVSSDPWEDAYGDKILSLPMDRVSIELATLESVLSRQEARRTSVKRDIRPINPPPLLRLLLLAALGLVGFALIAIGLRTPASFFAILTGAGVVLFAGAGFWTWSRDIVAKQRARKDAERRLAELEAETQKAWEQAVGLLSGIPLSEQNLRSAHGDLYSALSSMADLYQELAETREQALHVEQELQRREEAAKLTGAKLSFDTTREHEALIEELVQALREAVDRKAAALQAKRLLDDEITPKLEELRRDNEGTLAERDRVERRLRELGDGDIEAGIRHARDLHKAHADLRQARARLVNRYPELAAIERALRDSRQQGKGKVDLEAEAQQFEGRLTLLSAELESAEQELGYCPPVFSGMDEPIRRYLLYGGKSAETFLIRACRMMHEALTTGVIPQAAETGLPERIVRRFEEWWKARGPAESYQPESVTRTDGQRLQAPLIWLDSTTGEVMAVLRPQRFFASLVADGDLSLEVTGEVPTSQRRSYPLRLYKFSEHLVESEKLEFPLPFPSRRYKFRLRSSTEAVQQWELATSGQFYAFDDRTKRLINEEALPTGRLWLLLHRDYLLRPDKCALFEAGALHGSWKPYILRELDLEDVDELTLINRLTQRPLTVPLSFGEPPALGFVGGQQIQEVHSEGVDVYADTPPSINIPTETEAELRFWRLSLLPGEGSSPRERKHYRLSELTEALQVKQGCAELFLTHEKLLGQQPLGSFQVRLHRSPYTDWRRTVCISPKLHIVFKRPLYLPYESGPPPIIEAEVSTPENAQFIPQPPARRLQFADGRTVVRADAVQDSLSGLLSFRRSDGEFSIPLTLSIPKVRWRFQGLEEERYTTWNDTIQEVWIGELPQELFLIVETPAFLEGRRVSLGLAEHSTKRSLTEVREHRARFDLLAFADAFRGGASVQTLTLTLETSDSGLEIRDTPLVKVRTRWEAEDMQCVQTVQGRNVILEVTWNERGKAPEKVLRLWRESGPALRPIKEQVIRGETRSARIVVDVAELTPGLYLLQLLPRDPWSATALSRPPAGGPNTLTIHIVTAGDLRRGQVFLIDSAQDDRGRLHNLEISYRVKIIGKIVNRILPSRTREGRHVLVTETNEGWYAGRLEVVVFDEPAFLAEIEDANPVKLEYAVSADCVTAIEDRYGEGPMLCANCRRLYWSDERLKDEERRKHSLFGPIAMFPIRWER